MLPKFVTEYTEPVVRQMLRRLRRTVSSLTVADQIVTITSLGYFSYAATGWSTGIHAHDQYELHIILTGHGQYELEGMVQEVGPDSIILHGPGVRHNLTVIDTPFSLLHLPFTMEAGFLLPAPEYWPVRPDFRWELALLLQEAGEAMPGWQQRAATRLGTLLSKAFGLLGWPGHMAPIPPPAANLVGKVDGYLRDNVDRSLTLDEIASHVGWSPRSLRRHFTRLAGEPVMERLFRMRMQKAAFLLCDTGMKVAHIGALVAMPDISYFCRRFRKFFGMTPEEFRRQQAAHFHAGGEKPGNP